MWKGCMLLASFWLWGLAENLQAERVLQQMSKAAGGGYLVQGIDGNYYGTMTGTMVFKMTPDGTVRPVAFPAGFHPDGLNAELTLADDGNIYGTTKTGGAGYGTVFQITPGGQLFTFYSFSAANPGPTGLRNGTDGTMYGVTGTNSDAFIFEPKTIFQLTTSGTLTTLHAVTNPGPGYIGAPVQGSDGSLYGGGLRASLFGLRVQQDSVIYKIPPGGSLQSLYQITNDVISGELIFGPDGVLYGTTGQASSSSR